MSPAKVKLRPLATVNVPLLVANGLIASKCELAPSSRMSAALVVMAAAPKSMVELAKA